MSKTERKQQLVKLIDRYNQTTRVQDRSNISEETIRTWLNEFLGIFGWDVQNTAHVHQERMLRGTPQQRLQEIDSPHRKPDYIFLNGSNIKSFLDAKSLDVNLFTDEKTAFQIRSYGWSAQSPCAFVSNFEQFCVYDTRFVPVPGQPANLGTREFIIDEYVERFDEIYELLNREYVCSNHLEDLYEVTAVEGTNSVDKRFMEILASFRTELAQNILKKNTEIIKSDIDINYYTQVILDRIVFIRVCESKGIEEQEKLKHFIESSDGFWKTFRNSCYMEFYDHYDGAMFSRDDEFQKLELDDDIIVNFVNKLYHPYPYRFDVIPVKVLANIYEEFLGKQLTIDSGMIKEVIKDEYVRTNGAIVTPEYIVEMVCKQTLSIDSICNIEDLLRLKLLDPCCGSGVFSVSCYEQLASRMIQILEGDGQQRIEYPNFFYVSDNKLYLTIEGRREILKNCIYAVDIDEAAIEVTKMSLALKVVDGNDPIAWEGIGAFGDKILKDIVDNIKLGNSLVSFDDRFLGNQIQEIKPFDFKLAFNEVFDQDGGFSYILGNPPYVETKHYKAAHPIMHTYLKENFKTFQGKADLAVLFIEKCLDLLNDEGRLGFIIQRRWFKTVYGGATRILINEGKHLEKLIDIEATDVFKGRIVYPSIMILSKQQSDEINYYCMPDDVSEVRTKFENSDLNGLFDDCEFSSIPSQMGSSVWAFDKYEIIRIKSGLSSKFGNLQGYPQLDIKDGIQALWKKMYHIKNVSFSEGIATGVNGFNEVVSVEKDILRGVIYNKIFYPFKAVDPDAYCIFPYEGASDTAIVFSDLKERFPLAHKYLSDNEMRIKGYVQHRSGDLWHTFTREHNQKMYNVDKIIIPMTAQDTIATYVSGKGLYMDNSNVWFITVKDSTTEVMKAITCVINSTIFSVLGKVGANPQANGYFKFNKQFLAPIPFPSQKIQGDNDIVRSLAEIYDIIRDLQDQYLSAVPLRMEVISQALTSKWNELDDLCYSIYEIEGRERALISSEGRTINRIKLLQGAR